MYPEDRGAALVGEHGCPDARGRGPCLRCGVAHDLAERALPRDPDQDRPPERGELVEPPKELEVVLDRLPEADPGIEADRLLADSLRNRERQALVEEARDLGDHVVVARIG